VENANQIAPVRARQIMHSYTPRGWKVKMGGAQQRGASGLCDWSEKRLYVPLVCDDYSLFVFLHECGHVRCRHGYDTRPSHMIEYEAEMYAQGALRECGFRVTREITRAGKAYVADEIIKDRIKGLPIDPQVNRWANRKSRCVARSRTAMLERHTDKSHAAGAYEYVS
jgi:hypothetical protein